MTCAACRGPTHPATAHAWTPTVVICGPCARHWMAFVRVHTRPRKGPDFYAAAATSVRAPQDG